ncbi:hypothetical protein GCM10010415_28330 [Streptomyces atrovirens]|uniref:fascin domain-containing protein n=1 Tax=Streptomyces atrovirens TaxID=285556 RepID=UPI0031E044C5
MRLAHEAEGGPAVRTGAGGDALVAVAGRSRQGGCFGSGETRRDAVETRVDTVGARQGELRARGDEVGGREQFALRTRDGGKTVALRSAAGGLFVSTGINRTGDHQGMPRARSDDVAGGWERFAPEHADDFGVVGADPAGPAPLPLG